MSLSTNTLDKTSEYYRICPYCREEFMADHMSREYCNDDCGNNFNNRIKRLNKRKLNLRSPNIDESIKRSNNTDRSFEDQLNRNICILYELSIDPELGAFISYEYLDTIGLDINYFSNRIPVKNTLNNYKIQMGSFSISRTKQRIAHIETIKTNKK
jgi:ribosomal protein S27AE